jgi:hypothetical protein
VSVEHQGFLQLGTSVPSLITIMSSRSLLVKHLMLQFLLSSYLQYLHVVTAINIGNVFVLLRNFSHNLWGFPEVW